MVLTTGSYRVTPVQGAAPVHRGEEKTSVFIGLKIKHREMQWKAWSSRYVEFPGDVRELVAVSCYAPTKTKSRETKNSFSSSA